MEISLEQAYKGFTAEILFPRRERCPRCNGQARKTRAQDTTCNKCQGNRTIIRDRRIRLKIPPGVQTGSELQLRGDGDAPVGGNGPNGDLYVAIHVKEHQVFTREGHDLTCHIRAPLHKTTHGGEVEDFRYC